MDDFAELAVVQCSGVVQALTLYGASQIIFRDTFTNTFLNSHYSYAGAAVAAWVGDNKRHIVRAQIIAAKSIRNGSVCQVLWCGAIVGRAIINVGARDCSVAKFVERDSDILALGHWRSSVLYGNDLRVHQHIACLVRHFPSACEGVIIEAALRRVGALCAGFGKFNNQVLWRSAVIMHITVHQRRAYQLSTVAVPNAIVRDSVALHRDVVGHRDIGVELGLLRVHNLHLKGTGGHVAVYIRRFVGDDDRIGRHGKHCAVQWAACLHDRQYVAIVLCHRDRPVDLCGTLVNIVAHHDHCDRAVDKFRYLSIRHYYCDRTSSGIARFVCHSPNNRRGANWEGRTCQRPWIGSSHIVVCDASIWAIVSERRVECSV